MNVETQFVGTWSLVSQTTFHADGKVSATRGENPVGVLVYDAQGNMVVQAMRNDDRAADFTDPAEWSTTLHGFLAYFGTYTVDTAQKIVRHHIIGSTYPGYRGDTQVRLYEFSGDTLTLSLKVGSDGSTSALVWRRVAGKLSDVPTASRQENRNK